VGIYYTRGGYNVLTSLSFLDIGEVFPPECERDRIKTYNEHRALFECNHAEVYKEELKRIERVISNFQDIVSYPVIFNYQKLMSLKVADLLLGEVPSITSKTSQETIDEIIKTSDLINTAYQAAIDVSRYGDGLLEISKEGIDITQPCIWYPVVDIKNIHKIVNHVIAWADGDTLNVRIHYRGSYETRTYKLDGETIAKETEARTVVRTGLSDFAIIQIPNILVSDRITGMDDYTDIDSIVADIMVRVGQIDRILDKHANPSVQGAASALERDPITGEYRLKMGGYFARDTNDDPEVKYITWDGQLEANFKQIDKLTQMLYTISEMGSAVFGDLSTSTGQVPSGSALKRLMISPLAKVNRVRMRFDPALKQAIQLCSELGGIGIKKITDVAIKWADGLPSDPVEEAAIMKSRTADKATMSQYRALKVYDGMTDEEADEEMARISDEESTPVSIPEIAQGEESEEQEAQDEQIEV
jgi:hypothetical protein